MVRLIELRRREEPWAEGIDVDDPGELYGRACYRYRRALFAQDDASREEDRMAVARDLQLAAQKGFGDAKVYYAGAIVAAEMGMARQVLDHLKAARLRGWDHWDWIARDKRLRNVLQDKELYEWLREQDPKRFPAEGLSDKNAKPKTEK